MKILIVNGRPLSGKDLFCEYAKKNRKFIYAYSTIDEVKKLAKLLGWNGIKDMNGRKFLSDLKDALTAYNDLPRLHILEQINKQIDKLDYKSNDAIFLVQMREPEEIKRWQKLHDAKALFVYRKDNNKAWGNHADDDVLQIETYDYYLFNDGTKEDWEQRVVEFIDKLKQEQWESHL